MESYWEYKVLTLKSDLEFYLNQAGKDNWELVGISTVVEPNHWPTYVCTFKKMAHRLKNLTGIGT